MPRTRKRSQRPLTLSGLLLALIAIAAFVAFNYFFPNVLQLPGLSPADGDPNPTGVSVVGSGDWYQLYFTDPPARDNKEDRPTESVDDPVVAGINSAQRTVDAATYDFNLPTMVDAFIAAKKRGVIVRIVTDTDSMAESEVKRLAKSGVKVVEDKRSAIMHHKFVILDGQWVWMGSWNFSENDTYRNNNNVLGLASPEMVANYQTVFDHMFEQKEFGRESTANIPYPEFKVNGVPVENYFSPDGGVVGHILPVLQNAKQSIYFAAFTFTRDDFTDVLLERAKAGVEVKGVYETRQVSAGADQSYNRLRRAKLPVLLDGNPYTMHHKFFVVDGQVVVTGSYNFTKAAEENNNENVLIIHNADIAAKYYQEFLKVWQKAGGN